MINLSAVLQKLATAGMKLKPEKCLFMIHGVEYLGHKISTNDLQPTQEKACAIIEAPSPRNVSELKSFLGMLNYYGKFLPNLSTRLAPLNASLTMTEMISLVMGCRANKALEQGKTLLTSSCLLTH